MGTLIAMWVTTIGTIIVAILVRPSGGQWTQTGANKSGEIMNRDAIRHTIDSMSQDKAISRFDMEWHYMDESGLPCSFEAHVFSANEDHPDAKADATDEEYVRAGRILGLDEEQSMRLFLISDPHSECWYPHVRNIGQENITAGHAIGTLVHLLHTGEVNWDEGLLKAPFDK